MRTSLFILLLVAVPAAATDTYVLQGFATGATVDCKAYLWETDVLFYNRGNGARTVRLIGVSNGGAVQPRAEFPVEPRKSTTLRRENAGWSPSATVPLWVAHFDMPDDVAAESRMEIGYLYPCVSGSPQTGSGAIGKVSFPTYRSLQPAGVPKIHLGTDAAQVPSRINVAVYNAGTSTATVNIELRQSCDDTLITSRDIAVPADTALQVGGFRNDTKCSINPAFGYMTYVIVTSDQPGLSWISVLPTADELKVTYAVPVTSP
jgi:hypothetical protein